MRTLSIRFAAAVRWLHIYVSLLGFTMLFFFAATGITLNHPSWLGADEQRVSEHQGEMAKEWLNRSSGQSKTGSSGELTSNPEADETEHDRAVDKLQVAEYLRGTHQLRGAVREFRVDEQECMVVFKGPGYAADAFIDRQTGKYTISITTMGAVAILNDLHKGRDSGPGWSLLVDLSAALTIFVSITGLILIFYLKRKRWSGILTAVAGTLLLVAAYWVLVP